MNNSGINNNNDLISLLPHYSVFSPPHSFLARYDAFIHEDAVTQRSKNLTLILLTQGI